MILRPAFAIAWPAFAILWPVSARPSPALAILWLVLGAFGRLRPVAGRRWRASRRSWRNWPLPAGRRRTPAGGGSLPVREASLGVGLVSYVGSGIGSIRIESRLGQGGMGEVYLGYDPRLGRRVTVDPDLARFEGFLSESPEL